MTADVLTTRPLGAPGVYEAAPIPLRVLTRERMDVCAFVGVAPRGPAGEVVFDASWAGPRPGRRDDSAPRVLPTVPVVVESWTEYRRIFGGFEGPGLLPYAVASFFEQGGRRAYIARIVHRYDSPPDNLGVGQAALQSKPDAAALRTRGGAPVILRARNEGRWGNELEAKLTFGLVPRHFETATSSVLAFPNRTPLVAGTLLRLTLPGGARVLRYVSLLRDEWNPEDETWRRYATLEYAAPAAPVRADVVEGVLTVTDMERDTGPEIDRHERLKNLGFSAQHPRWLGAVLWRESAFLAPDSSWIDDDLDLDAALPELVAGPFTGGLDRYDDITPEDFFDPDPDRPLEEDGPPRAGVHALADIEEISLLVVPDLYSPALLAPQEDVISPPSLAGPEFAPCVSPGVEPKQENVENELLGLLLDPAHGNDLDEIIDLQRRLVRFAEQVRSFIVLLDVPPLLRAEQVARWRTQFNSAFAAAYHPWPDIARLDDRRDAPVRVNPAAVAAGVIAEREWLLGVPQGPANVLIASAVRLSDEVTASEHDMLHPLGINVLLRERDGMRLTAARTLSHDPDYRQLSVRRLVTMLERVLERQMQWAVFEPNNTFLREDLRHLLEAFLGELFRANAFRGTREEEAFFVRCDATLNDQRTMDRGQIIAEVGIAPAEPLEFIVLRILQGGDGTLRVEE